MSLMVHAQLKDIYNIVCSRHFIYKIFMLQDKSVINKVNNEHISYKRTYNHNDLNVVSDMIEIPDNFMDIIQTNLHNIDIIFDSLHEVIKNCDNSFVIKYTSILKEPGYIHQILGDTKIILYVQFTVNKNDPSMTIVHFNKKLVNAYDADDDSVIINASKNDIITNIYQQNTLHINESIVGLSEALLGHNFVHNCIIPTINSIFNMSFSILQDVYTVRFIKYMSKKNIELYKKKESGHTI
jgi:hypothetical protein